MCRRKQKMNMLEIQILKTLLAKESLTKKGLSIYELNKTLREAKVKTNYTTVWRHLKRMLKEKLIEIAEKGKRKAQLLTITDKGIATYLLKGNPSKEELLQIGLEFHREFINKLKGKEAFLVKDILKEVFANSLLKIKPKVNLEFFDNKWFREVWVDATLESLNEAVKKYKTEFEKAEIWESKEERIKEVEDLINLLEEFRGSS